MTITFNHSKSPSGYDLLTTKTNQHVKIDILFDNGTATHVYIDENEFKVIDDTLYGLFVGIGDKMMSLVEVVREADRQYPAIAREVAQEVREAAREERKLSSPCMTGRI